MKNMLKKYWFILTIAFILIAFSLLFLYANVKDKLPGKKVNGKDVVAIFNEKTIFADDIFENAKEVNGYRVISTLILEALANQEIPTTDEIKKNVAAREAELIEGFKQKNPQGYQEEMSNALKQLGFANGYADLSKYVTSQIKIQQIMENYILANKDKYFKEIETKKGRLVSHILVRYPQLTAAEKEGKKPEEITKLQNERNAKAEAELNTKKDAVDKALASKDFGEVAAEFSDDEASKVKKGSLGYVNSDTSFVKEFLDASLKLNEGQVSDWIKTTYGYHKIKVDAVGAEKLLQNKEIKAQILNTILQQHTDIYKLAIQQLIQKYPVQTEDATVKKIVDSLVK